MTGEPARGWVDEAVRAELPGLRLWSLAVTAPPADRASGAGLRVRLQELAGRVYGAQAIALRREPVPHAYRVLFRQIGLDPDEDRTPIEAVVRDRLLHGGFRSRGRLEDALTVALVETSVPVWALDGTRVEGALGVRAAGAGEGVPAGRLVVADARGPVCELFAPPPADRAATAGTTSIVLFTVQPSGVPAIHVEEALWTVSDALA